MKGPPRSKPGTLWEATNGSPVLQGLIIFGLGLVVYGVIEGVSGSGSDHFLGPALSLLGALILATIVFRYHPSGEADPRWGESRLRRTVRLALQYSWRFGVMLIVLACAFAAWDQVS